MIQITSTEVVNNPKSIRQAQIEFAKYGCVFLPAFLSRPLARFILKPPPSTEFALLAKSPGCSGDARPVPTVAGALFDLEFIVNRPAFCKAVGRIADSSTIDVFFSSTLVVAEPLGSSVEFGRLKGRWRDTPDHRPVGFGFHLAPGNGTHAEAPIEVRDATRGTSQSCK